MVTMTPPAMPEDYTPEELAAAAAAMARVLAEQPELGSFGFGVFLAQDKTPAQREAELRAHRQQIVEPASLAQFLAARNWLRQFSKRQSINRTGTSYGLKHVAEHDIGYATNGAFIAAAIAEEFRVLRAGPMSPNAFLAISARAWERSLRRGDGVWWNARRSAWCDDAGNVISRG